MDGCVCTKLDVLSIIGYDKLVMTHLQTSPRAHTKELLLSCHEELQITAKSYQLKWLFAYLKRIPVSEHNREFPIHDGNRV